MAQLDVTIPPPKQASTSLLKSISINLAPDPEPVLSDDVGGTQGMACVFKTTHKVLTESYHFVSSSVLSWR